MLNPLAHPICLVTPDYLPPSAWKEHIPFGMFLVAALRPRVLVELGSHYGCSYCAFCRAVAEAGLDTRCFAVDTWKGDPHAQPYDGGEVLAQLRAHHDPKYGHFSRLLEATFDEARLSFADGSIDLLHIDGYHTYEAVRHDFETWLPKVSASGVILFHDTAERQGDFGVWRLWEELQARYRTFEFHHGHGLGVLTPGEGPGGEAGALFAAQGGEAEAIRHLFLGLGREVVRSEEEQRLRAETARWQHEAEAVRRWADELVASLAALREQHDAVLQSVTWRWSAPLRKTLGTLRGLALPRAGDRQPDGTPPVTPGANSSL
jgi:hypothetical protein